MTKMAAAWREEETVKLIELWGEDDIQEKLEGCTRNKHIPEDLRWHESGWL